jgi:hypothetical protein
MNANDENVEHHRTQLIDFYHQHEPSKLNVRATSNVMLEVSLLMSTFVVQNVDDILESFRGREGELFEMLQHKYENPHRRRLVEFYKQHNPSKVLEVDSVLADFRGREQEMYRKLHHKYLDPAKQPGAFERVYFRLCARDRSH